MKKTLITIGIFTSLGALAQSNVGIGTLNPNNNAILEIKSEDKGVLISRLTTVARNTLGTALTANDDGMLVYDKNLKAFYYWDGAALAWVQVGSGTGDNWGTQVVQTSGANISGDGTSANPLTVTDGDSDPNNEIELPTGGTNGQVLTTDGSGNYTWATDDAGTDDQNIANLAFDNTTNILTVGIENGNSQTIDLTPLLNDADSDPNNEIELPTGGTNGQVLTTDGSGNYTWATDDAGTDDQNISGSGLSGTTLTIGIENGNNETVDLSTLVDHDWYKQGTTSAPTNISDNIFTQGNVGIGVTTPASTLDVNGDILYSGNTMTNLKITSTSDDIFMNMIKVATGSTNAQIKFDGYGAPQDQGQIRFYTRWDPSNGGTGTLNHVMSITEKAFVGIGTTTPNAPLEVVANDNLTASKIAKFRRNGTGSTGDISFYSGASTGDYNGITQAGDKSIIFTNDNDPLTSASTGLVIAPWTNSTNPDSKSGIKIQENGNVGIGIGSPTSKLTIDAKSTNAVEIRANDTFSEIFMKTTNTTAATKAFRLHYGGNNSTQNQLRFGRTDLNNTWEANPVIFDMDAPSNSIYLLDNGNVGMGTSVPNYQLHNLNGARFNNVVIGADAVDNTGTTIIDYAFHYEAVGMQSTATNLRLESPNGVYIHTNMSNSEPDDNSKTRMRIESNGNVAIGNATPSTKLDVQGNLRVRNLPTGNANDQLLVADANGNVKKVMAGGRFFAHDKTLKWTVTARTPLTDVDLGLGATNAKFVMVSVFVSATAHDHVNHLFGKALPTCRSWTDNGTTATTHYYNCSGETSRSDDYVVVMLDGENDGRNYFGNHEFVIIPLKANKKMDATLCDGYSNGTHYVKLRVIGYID